MKFFLIILALCLFLFVASSAAQTVPNPTACLGANVRVVLLLEGDHLASFPASGSRSAKLVKVTGADGKLQAIDTRVSNGVLYGINERQVIYSINLETGNATLVSNLTNAIRGAKKVDMDFNPLADRLRLISKSKFNYRVNVDISDFTAVTNDTNLHYATILPGNDTDDNNDDNDDNNDIEMNSKISGIAYSGNTQGSLNTTLYAIDSRGRNHRLVTINPPNNGTINRLFRINLPKGNRGAKSVHGFDIFTQAAAEECELAALAVNNRFYSLDLQSGNTTRIWNDVTKWLVRDLFANNIEIVDFAFWEETSSVAV